MADLLAAATQEPAGHGSRKPSRVVESADEDDQTQAGPSRSKRINLNPEDFEEERPTVDEEAELNSEPEEPNELEGWTIDTFEDKPVLNGSVATRTLDTQKSQIDVAIKTLDLHARTLIEVGVAIEEARPSKDDQQSQDMFDKTDTQLKNSLDRINRLQIEKDVLNLINEKLKADGQINDIKGYYRDEVERRREVYSAKSEWARFKDNEVYQEFRESTHEVNNHGSAQPLMSDVLEKRNDEDDSDIETGGVTLTYTCPFTLLPFVDAYTSRVCKHTFEGDAIKQHIKAVPGNLRDADKAAKCPVTGCTNQIKLADIAPNPVFQKKVNRHYARAEERQQETAANQIVHEII